VGQYVAIEFSSDGGTTWQSGTSFPTLPDGCTRILYRAILTSNTLTTPVLDWVNVSYELSYYPYNVSVYISDTMAWNNSGEVLNTTVRFNITDSTIIGVQNSIFTQDIWGNNLSILNLNISVSSRCRLNITNLTINYSYNATVLGVDYAINHYLNTHPRQLSVPVNITSQDSGGGGNLMLFFYPSWDYPPVRTGSIPDIPEDEVFALNLTDIFDDDYGAENLNFTIGKTSDNITWMFSSSDNHILLIQSGPDWFGSAYITIVVNDSYNRPVEFNLTVNITPVDDPPYFKPIIPLTGYTGREFSVNLSDYINDTDTPHENLTLSCNISEVWFTGHILHANFSRNGTFVVSITVSDGNNTFTKPDVHFIITTLIPPEVYPPENTNILDNQSFTFNLSQYCHDPDNYGLSYEIKYYNSSLLALNLTVSDGAIINITPIHGAISSGEINTTIEVLVSDETGLNTTMILNITIISSNRPPVCELPAYLVLNDTDTLQLKLDEFIYDPDNDTLVLSLVQESTQFFVGDIHQGVLFINPTQFANGTSSITVQATDEHGISTSGNITITIIHHNIPPFQQPPLPSPTILDTNFTIDLTTFFHDPEGELLNFNITTVESNPSLEFVLNGSILTLIPTFEGPGGVVIFEITATDANNSAVKANLSVNITPWLPPEFTGNIPDIVVEFPAYAYVEIAKYLRIGSDRTPKLEIKLEPDEGYLNYTLLSNNTLSLIPLENTTKNITARITVRDKYNKTTSTTLPVHLKPQPVENEENTVKPKRTNCMLYLLFLLPLLFILLLLFLIVKKLKEGKKEEANASSNNQVLSEHGDTQVASPEAVDKNILGYPPPNPVPEQTSYSYISPSPPAPSELSDSYPSVPSSSVGGPNWVSVPKPEEIITGKDSLGVFDVAPAPEISGEKYEDAKEVKPIPTGNETKAESMPPDASLQLPPPPPVPSPSSAAPQSVQSIESPEPVKGVSVKEEESLPTAQPVSSPHPHTLLITDEDRKASSARKKNARKEQDMLQEVNERLAALEKVIDEIKDRGVAEELEGHARLVRTYRRSKNYGKCLKFLEQADKQLNDLGMADKMTSKNRVRTDK
ncbi:MAG: hypothetical protein QW728_05705, partial [Thermoplasmata archaeon]